MKALRNSNNWKNQKKNSNRLLRDRRNNNIQQTNCSKLKELYLDENNITAKGVKHLCEALKFNTNLILLDLGGNQILDQGANLIAEMLYHNKTLNELKLNDNIIVESGVSSLCDALKINSTLTSLYLSENPISEIGITSISKMLRENTTLTSLELNQVQLNINGIEKLSSSLKVNKTLIFLSLEKNEIADDQLKPLALALTDNCGLQNLNLSSNLITDSGAFLIADFLRKNSHLKILDLFHNKIGDIGSVRIAESLKINTCLEDLEIGNNDLNSQWALGYGSLLSSNPNLKYLKFRSSGTTYIETVFRALNTNTNLITINFGKMNIESESLYPLSEILTTNKSLKNLFITECSLNSKAAEILANGLIFNKSLEELDLSYNTLGSLGVRFICNSLLSNKSFKEIVLDNNEINDDATTYISNLLITNESLNFVSLLNNNFSLNSMRALLATNNSKNNYTEIKIFKDLSKFTYNEIESLLYRQKIPNCFSVSSLQLNQSEMKHFCNLISSVTNLSITNNKLNTKILSCINDLVVQNEKIQELNLTYNEISYFSIAQGFSKVLKESKTLKDLDLGWNNITELGIPAIVDSLKHNEKLEVLALNSNMLQDEGAILISDILKEGAVEDIKEAGNSKLFKLRERNKNIILDQNVTTSEYENSIENFGDCDESLESLLENKNKVFTLMPVNTQININPEINSAHIQYSISKIPEIQFLGKKLLRSEPSILEKPSDLSKLCEFLKSDTFLTRLDFGHKNLDNNAAVTIAEMMKVNCHLKEIYLNNNKFTWKGGLAIIEALELNKNISVVNLDDNNLGDTGAVALSKLISVNKTLTKFYLARNNITSEGIQEILETKQKFKSSIDIIT
jgi:Ran GTPase-activating protein (RanGAP) involved in mRNA processing and transport